MSDLFLRPLYGWRRAIASENGPQSPITRHVLLTLSLHMNDLGESCFPSIDLLVKETGLGRRSVIEHLRLAASNGWVGKKVTPMPENGKGWRRVDYFALIPDGVPIRIRKGGARRAPAKASAPDAPASGGASHADGDAPHCNLAVHPAHPNSSVRTSGNSYCPLSADEFDVAWKAYPKRAGENSRTAAAKAWNGRIKQGVKAQEMIDGVKRYAIYCEAEGKVGTQYVKLGATFFGPNRHWEEPHSIPPKATDVDKPLQLVAKCFDCGGPFTGGSTQRDRGRICNACFTKEMAPPKKAAVA